MAKKDKKKQLAITSAPPEEATSTFSQNEHTGLDDTLDKSVAIDVEVRFQNLRFSAKKFWIL